MLLNALCGVCLLSQMRNDSALIETPLQANTVADVEVNIGLLQPPVKDCEGQKKRLSLRRASIWVDLACLGLLGLEQAD